MTGLAAPLRDTPELRVGDWVEVKSAEQILATLDAEGSRDALPFMPEMLHYCGKRFRVSKSAHKGCDTIKTWRNRRMNDAVHLEDLRCTGGAHDACQAGCLLYWKTAWLKPVPGPTGDGETGATPPDSAADGGAGCDLDTLQRGTRAPAAEGQTERPYRCQATEMFRATTPTHWDPSVYVKDITSGNVSLPDFVRFGLLALLNRLRRFPHIRGRAKRRTPQGEVLNLQPGEWVEVRTKDEILLTLNRGLRHRGLSFDIEMLPFCGRRFRVLRRVERLIDDRNGKMLFPKSACLILENVTCSGCRSRNRMFCPRAIYPYWHEVWLKRVEHGDRATGTTAPTPA